MPHLTDSDIVIRYLDDDPATLQLLALIAIDELAISMVSFMEMSQGILESPNGAAVQRRFDAFLAEVPILPFTEAVALRCARLRSELKREGRRIRPRP